MATLTPPPDGDVTRGTTFIVLVVVLSFFSMVTTALRVGVRLANRQQGWDDFTIALALILLMIQVIFSGLQYHSGAGRHSYYLTPERTMDTVKWSFAVMTLFFVIVCLTKISIFLLILRAQKTGWIRWVLYAMIAGSVITTVAPEIILFTQCRPISSFWDGKGKCVSQSIYTSVLWTQAGRVAVINLLYAMLTICKLMRSSRTSSVPLCRPRCCGTLISISVSRLPCVVS